LKPLHDTCAPGVQMPVMHAPALVSDAAPVGHVGLEQVVPFGYFSQWPPPSHLPSVAHAAAPWSVQNEVGAGVPAGSGVHAPVPAAHAAHDGQLAEPQHTPSTQLPLMHWVPVVHARPLALSAQLLVAPAPWQVKGGMQSPSIAHTVLQAPAPQT
jgi:hypothetical protein